MTWYIWIILGLGLFLLELLTPGGFYMFFFAAGAVAAGICAGAAVTLPLWGQILVFLVVSIVSLLAFRRKLVDRFQGSGRGTGTLDNFAEEIAIPSEDLAPGAVGKAELRGTRWTARNGTDQKLKKGQRCRVDRVDGLMVVLKPE